MKKKICVVTAARSEYGVLRWIIDEIYNSPQLELILVVTGGHLCPEQGNTWTYIEKDGYPIYEKIDMHLDSISKSSIAKSMGYCSLGLADIFETIDPDLLLVLGDRYELLPICSTAVVMNIPIAHISGGDVTEGAIDDMVRNAVTMMSVLHFPSTIESANNIQRMINSDKNIFVVGEPGLDNFRRLNLMTKRELANSLNIPINKKWVLLTYHSETKASLETNMSNLETVVKCLLDEEDLLIVATKANSDFGGVQINAYLESIAQQHSHKFKLFASLGQLRYLSFMQNASLVIGNSSSGVFEAPYCKVPVLNIGNRQKGRYLCENVTTVYDLNELPLLISKIQANKDISDACYYGNGTTSTQILTHIINFLVN